MTARMADPSQRAKKLHDLAPKADFVKAPDHRRSVDAARSRGKSTASAASASEIDVNKPLTEKQKQFVQAWAEGNSLTVSAHRAGFANDGIAYRLARMPNILALKAQYEAKYEEESQMSRKKILGMHMEAFEMAKLMAEPATMVSAARELGKLCGYYQPVEHRVKVDITGNVVLERMNSMSDAELLKIITQGAQTVTPTITFSDESDSGGEDE